MAETTGRRRVLYVLRGFPQISQTYVKNEVEEIAKTNDILILSRKRADRPYRNHFLWTDVRSVEEATEYAREFRPDVIHAHYLNQLDFVSQLSNRIGVPYTLRSHSFDLMALRGRTIAARLKRLMNYRDPSYRKADKVRALTPLLAEDGCLGVLAFPFGRPLLEAGGAPPDKIVDCFPVVKVEDFLDRSPNGDRVMNTGAVIPKKRMEDFLDLAKRVPTRRFVLYPLGYRVDQLEAKNRQMGAPVEFHAIVEPEEMPAQYKKNAWMVYTGDFDLKTVGWPMAVAEAQASGCGVCMPNLRPDLREYVGEAAILYDDVRELPDIIARPPPDEMREAGFAQAQKSDIRGHINKLTDLWPQAA